MTYDQAELLEARMLRAKAQLIIDARLLKDLAENLKSRAKSLREQANLLHEAQSEIWQKGNQDAIPF